MRGKLEQEHSKAELGKFQECVGLLASRQGSRTAVKAVLISPGSDFGMSHAC